MASLVSLSLILGIGFSIDCGRPGGWCTHGGSTYKVRDCPDGKRPVCTDTAGRVGVRFDRGGRCVDSWPTGVDTCLDVECDRPRGWCSHAGSTFSWRNCDGQLRPVCTDNAGRKGTRYELNGRCYDTWPSGPINCGFEIECPRPGGWCSHRGSTFKYRVCDGVSIPTCTDTAGRVGQRFTDDNGRCKDTWPSGADSCVEVECPRPPGWCSHANSKFTWKNCDGRLRPVCTDNAGNKGMRLEHNGRCIDTWPSGPITCGADFECARPGGWCTHAGSKFEYKNCDGQLRPTCTDNRNNMGVIYNKNGAGCRGNWPVGPIACNKLEDAPIDCPRPAGWCTHGGSTFKYKRCDGVLIPTCTDTAGRAGQRRLSNGRCIDTWPGGADRCAPVETKRPNGWCSHSASTFSWKKCDGELRPVCTDTAGNKGTRFVLNGRVWDTWPSGPIHCGMDIPCPRPPGWCSHRGSSFKYVLCDGMYRPTCTDNVGRFGQRYERNGRCIDTWPGGVGNCRVVNTIRPWGWCSHRGSTFKWKRCGDEYIPQCTDGAGNIGQRYTVGGRVTDSWPRGSTSCPNYSAKKVNMHIDSAHAKMGGETKLTSHWDNIEYTFRSTRMKYQMYYFDIILALIGLFMLCGVLFFVKSIFYKSQKTNKKYSPVTSMESESDDAM